MAGCPNDDDDADNNSTTALPTLKYGYRTTPVSWSELASIVSSGDLARLSRSRAQQSKYELYKRDLLQSWTSILDYMLCDKFGYQVAVDGDESERKKYARHPTTADDGNDSPRPIIRKLLPNDFPYYMEENIEHWILWKIGGDCTDQDTLDAQDELQQRLGGGVACDFIHWVNPPHLQSLPELDHVHILVQTATRPSE